MRRSTRRRRSGLTALLIVALGAAFFVATSITSRLHKATETVVSGGGAGATGGADADAYGTTPLVDRRRGSATKERGADIGGIFRTIKSGQGGVKEPLAGVARTNDEGGASAAAPIGGVHGEARTGKDESDAVTVPIATLTNETAAICAIMKDEERYIDEWVDYNLLALGFDTIYLYDNSGNFTLKDRRFYAEDVLDDMEGKNEALTSVGGGEKAKEDAPRRRRVVIRHYPSTWKQRASYHDCFKNHGKKHGWLALIDGDEFVVLKKHSHIADMLAEHCPRGSLSINWYRFGTAGRTKYEPLPVLFRNRYREPAVVHTHKVIVRSSDYDLNAKEQKRGMASPHSASVVAGTTQHDTTGKITRGTNNPGGPTDVAVLYHMQYKSVEEWKFKWCTRGNVAGIFKRCHEDAVNGTLFDDAAWKALTLHVPKYRKYETGEGGR